MNFDSENNNLHSIRYKTLTEKVAFAKQVSEQSGIPPSFVPAQLCDPNKVFFKINNGQKVRRKWLFFENNRFYCSYCVCFSKQEENRFVKGVKYEKGCRVTDLVNRHDGEHNHTYAQNVFDELCDNIVKDKKKEKYGALEAMVKIIIYIATHALAFYGENGPVEKINFDPNKNFFRSKSKEGNFIGLTKLMASTDNLLAKHIKEVQERARKGCRYGMSFLSDKFLVDTLRAIGQYIIKCIVTEIHRNGGRFAIMMDGSRDITTQERMSVVVRFINDVYDTVERTVAFFNAKSTESYALFESLTKSLTSIGLAISSTIGCSFDGAMHMRSAANGVNGHIKVVNPRSIYIWCFSHRLHLAIQSIIAKTKIILAILKTSEDSAKMFRSSYVRMNVWVETAKNTANFSSKKRLKLIGATRWSSKQDAIATIMRDEIHLFVLLKSLYSVCRLPNLDGDALLNASANLNSWTQYEQVLSAFLLHQVFSCLGPTTAFLQKSGLSIVEGARSLKQCQQKLNDCQEDLDILTQMGHSFIEKVNLLIEKDCDLNAEEFKCLIHVPTHDERESILETITEQFSIFIQQLQDAIQKIHEMSGESNEIFNEIKYLSPLNDDESVTLKALCENNDVNEAITIKELKMLKVELSQQQSSGGFSFLKHMYTEKGHAANNDNDIEDNNDSNCSQAEPELIWVIENEQDLEEVPVENITEIHPMRGEEVCRCYCLKCIIKFIDSTNERKSKYSNIDKVFRYVAMLPVTQVQCERDFSKMKLTKTRIRASLGDETLETLMLISLHSNMFDLLDIRDIIKFIIEKSPSLDIYLNT